MLVNTLSYLKSKTESELTGNKNEPQPNNDPEVILIADPDVVLEDNGNEGTAIVPYRIYPVAEEVKKVSNEHFSQNKPEEFSSENFKIEVGGLPKYYPLGNFKKLLNNTLQLDAHKVKPSGMGRNVSYINFKSAEAREKAKLVLNGYMYQDHKLTAVDADPAKDPVLLKKIDFLTVPQKQHQNLPLDERIAKAVTPMHDMTYENQIKEKDRTVKNLMKKFGKEISEANEDLRDIIHWQKRRRHGQFCQVDDFVRSPQETAYRNKCEFTIGTTNETKEPIVGFRVAAYKQGSVEVGPIGHLRHISDTMKNVVKAFEEFLKQSEHEVFDPFSHNGIWRQLTVRTSNTGDLMLMVVIHPQSLEETEIQKIKDSFVSYFTKGDGSEASVTAMYIQRHGQLEKGQDLEYEHLWGKPYIEETILGKIYRASPDAFLQVNTSACEKLYEKVAEIADIDPTSVVLDICCGVGTIGLSTAENAYKVYGVELTPSACDNAKTNAEINGIKNAVFYNGRAEDFIDSMIQRSERTNVVAIIDPPRAGLHGSVMNAIRKCEYLHRVVYISCDPQAALQNLLSLCRPRSKTYKGTYFLPTRAIPVDLFPDTPHFELVILFERYEECKWDRIMAGNPRPKDQEYFNQIPDLSDELKKVDQERDARMLRQQKEREDRETHSAGVWISGGADFYQERRGGRSRPPPLMEQPLYDEDFSGRPGGNIAGDRRRRDRDDEGGPNQFGAGFQEGFQAALQTLREEQDFGHGGGWNMASNTTNLQGMVTYPGQEGQQDQGPISGNPWNSGQQDNTWDSDVPENNTWNTGTGAPGNNFNSAVPANSSWNSEASGYNATNTGGNLLSNAWNTGNQGGSNTWNTGNRGGNTWNSRGGPNKRFKPNQGQGYNQ